MSITFLIDLKISLIIVIQNYIHTHTWQQSFFYLHFIEMSEKENFVIVFLLTFFLGTLQFFLFFFTRMSGQKLSVVTTMPSTFSEVFIHFQEDQCWNTNIKMYKAVLYRSSSNSMLEYLQKISNMFLLVSKQLMLSIGLQGFIKSASINFKMDPLKMAKNLIKSSQVNNHWIVSAHLGGKPE